MEIGRRTFLKLSAAAGISGLLACYPVFIERYVILVNRYRIPVPNLPDAFNGFRIVHLTDLHYGFLVPLEIIRYVVRKANALAGDIIACTGDYVHKQNTTVEIDSVWTVLAGLRAREGVFSVLGNHDHWADTDRSLYWMDRTEQNLHGKARVIERSGERIWLAGGGDLWEDHVSFDGLLGDIPESDCRVVLAHNPDSADAAYSVRTDLIISGHTHGGQVDLPFIGTPVLPVRNRNYSSGLKLSEKNEKVFISKGIGWAIFPVRFNCYPEIAVLELVSGKE